MKGTSVISLAAILVLCGLGLTVLMAARTSERPGDGPAPPSLAHCLVCLGQVETPSPMTMIYPANFPQPSRVVRVLVREGDEVRKDQDLLELDNTLLKLMVQKAEVGVKAAEHELKKAQAAVRMHQSEIASNEKLLKAREAELEQANKELAEAKEAMSRFGSRNRLDLETAQAKVKAAELNLEAQRIKLDGMKAESPTYLVDLAREGQAKARNDLNQAAHALKQMSCKAPADGRIIRSFVAEGTTFGPQTREPAFWFIKNEPLIVKAEVTQEFAARIALDKTASIEDESDPTQRWTGRVIKVGDQFLPKRHGGASLLDLMPLSDDRVLECHLSLDVPSGRTGPKYGQRVRIRIE